MAAQTITPANKQNQQIEIDLIALFWHLLGKCYWVIVAALISAVLMGVYSFKIATPQYQTTSKIYIVGSDTTISLSDLQIGSNLAADYQEVFKNWHVHELVDRRLGLDYTYTQLSQMISITNPTNTHVIYITVTSPDPQEAKKIADTYAQVAREFIAAKMDMREPNIFEEAKLPDVPVSPNKTRNVVIGFLIGTMIAVGIITVQFVSDDKIRTSDDISKVDGLVTLGMMPLQDMKKNAKNGPVASNYYHGGKRKN